MISRLIFITGLVLLCFSIFSGIYLFWLLPSPKPAYEMIFLPRPPYPPSYHCECAGGGPESISETASSILAIAGELPKQMDRGTSYTIRVKLTSSTTDIATHYPSSNMDRTVLYPDITTSLNDDVVNYCLQHSSTSQEFSNCSSGNHVVKDLFGSGYELFASAHLVATSFDVQLLSTTEQSADQTSIEWIWNFSPKSADDQSIYQSIIQPIDLDVVLHWKPVNNSGKEDIFRQIWEDNPTITVNPTPFVARGQVTMSGVLSGLAGIIFTGFSLSYIYEQRKKRQEETEKNKVITQDDTQREKMERELSRERLEREKMERELSRERSERKRLEELVEQGFLEQKRKRERLEQKRKRERLERERFLYH